MRDYLENNPAGRLYLILSDVLKQPNNNDPMQKAWARIFGLDETDTEEIFLVYVELLRLLKSARESVEQLPDVDPDLYLKPFAQLERAFTVSSVVTNVQSFKQHLTERTMTSLQFCAHAISKVAVEKEIPEDILEQLRKSVDDLISDVLSSEFQYELRAFLIERLEEIRRAIIYYRINGSKGLQRALETTIGASYLLVQSSASLKFDDDEKKRRWSKIGKKFADVVLEISKAIAPEVAKALISSNFPMLPSS